MLGEKPDRNVKIQRKTNYQFQENAQTDGRADGRMNERMDRPYFIGPFQLGIEFSYSQKKIITLPSFFQLQQKLKMCQNSNLKDFRGPSLGDQATKTDDLIYILKILAHLVDLSIFYHIRSIYSKFSQAQTPKIRRLLHCPKYECFLPVCFVGL